MSESQGIMSEQEKEQARAWLSELEGVAPRKAASQEGKGKSRAEAKKLGAKLTLAAERGAGSEVAALIEAGANPNIRDRKGVSALSIAIEAAAKGVGSGMLEARDRILEAGGMVAPLRYSGMAGEFGAAAESGEWAEDLKKECARLTLMEFERVAQDWAGIKKAREALEAKVDKLEAALISLARGGRIGPLAQALEAGEPAPEKMWEELLRNTEMDEQRTWSPKKLVADEQRESWERMLRAGAAQMSQKDLESVWSLAVMEGELGLIKALIRAGRRPEGWMGKWPQVEGGGWRSKKSYKKLPLVTIAAIAEGSKSVFAALVRLEPAMRAAQEFKHEPRELGMMPVGKLMEMAARGVGIEAEDEVGGALHWWAKLDGGMVRDGWLSMAQKRPDLMARVNRAGKTPPQAMMETLGGRQKEEFMAALSKIESKELRKEVKESREKSGLSAKAKELARPRSRL